MQRSTENTLKPRSGNGILIKSTDFWNEMFPVSDVSSCMNCSNCSTVILICAELIAKGTTITSSSMPTEKLARETQFTQKIRTPSLPDTSRTSSLNNFVRKKILPTDSRPTLTAAGDSDPEGAAVVGVRSRQRARN